MKDRLRVFGAAAALAAAVLAFGAAFAAPRPAWVGSWASAQMLPENKDAIDPAAMSHATLRQIVRLTVGGEAVRVTLSNAFGTEPLHVAKVHVAEAVLPSSSAIKPATDRAVTFGGRNDVVIPAGANYTSDEVKLPVKARADLAITILFDQAPANETSHPGSRSTSYLLSGDHVGDVEMKDAASMNHWYQIAAVEVLARKSAGAVVALGDSITDGHASTTNGNDRWPDFLAERLVAAGAPVGVLNLGIGGNRLLNDGLGPNVLARFDRDVLAQNGVRTVIVLEGVNDLGVLTLNRPATPAEHAEMVARIVDSYRQIVLRAHRQGIRAIGATVTPYGGSDYYHPTAENEADRQAVNKWIRTPGNFDAVIDFDAALRDPEHHDRLLPAYDCGDHLHPSPVGYKAMAAAISLSSIVP